jgi:hypothetical protein
MRIAVLAVGRLQSFHMLKLALHTVILCFKDVINVKMSKM